MNYIYILLICLIGYYIISIYLQKHLENFDPSLVPVSSIVTLAKVAQKLVDGGGTLTNPGNLTLGTATAPGNLKVFGTTNLVGDTKIDSSLTVNGNKGIVINGTDGGTTKSPFKFFNNNNTWLSVSQDSHNYLVFRDTKVAEIDCDTTIKRGLTVTGNTTLNGSLTVPGNVYIGGNAATALMIRPRPTATTLKDNIYQIFSDYGTKLQIYSNSSGSEIFNVDNKGVINGGYLNIANRVWHSSLDGVNRLFFGTKLYDDGKTPYPYPDTYIGSVAGWRFQNMTNNTVPLIIDESGNTTLNGGLNVTGKASSGGITSQTFMGVGNGTGAYKPFSIPKLPCYWDYVIRGTGGSSGMYSARRGLIVDKSVTWDCWGNGDLAHSFDGNNFSIFIPASGGYYLKIEYPV
jgi:hypothetical protein